MPPRAAVEELTPPHVAVAEAKLPVDVSANPPAQSAAPPPAPPALDPLAPGQHDCILLAHSITFSSSTQSVSLELVEASCCLNSSSGTAPSIDLRLEQLRDELEPHFWDPRMLRLDPPGVGTVDADVWMPFLPTSRSSRSSLPCPISARSSGDCSYEQQQEQVGRADRGWGAWHRPSCLGHNEV